MARIRFALFTLLFGPLSVAPTMANMFDVATAVSQEVTWSGFVTVQTGRVLNTVKRTSDEPMFVGSLRATNSSGFWLEGWTAANAPGNHDRGAQEVDWTAGYNGRIGDDLAYTAKVALYDLWGPVNIVSYDIAATYNNMWRGEVEYLDPTAGMENGWTVKAHWLYGGWKVGGIYTTNTFGAPGLWAAEFQYTHDFGHGINAFGQVRAPVWKEDADDGRKTQFIGGVSWSF